MTGITETEKYTEDLLKFNDWISCNYETLQKHCKRYRIPEDTLQDVYLNVRERIVRSGFTETYFTTYVKRALTNLRINELKRTNGKVFIDVNDCNFTNTVENQLQTLDETEKDTQVYREEVMYFSKMLFMYIQQAGFDSEWQSVFVTYYLMPNRFTYAKLQAMCNINKNKCTTIITTMKKRIRVEFLPWLKEYERSGNN